LALGAEMPYHAEAPDLRGFLYLRRWVFEVCPNEAKAPENLLAEAG
jgi:hypothetical protein